MSGALPEPLDPALLARSAKGGDKEAFVGWLSATCGTVYRLALRMLHNGQEAEDVVQETYVRAWQKLPSLEDPAAHLGWVCRIARNVAVDSIRHKSRRELAVLDAPAGDEHVSLLEQQSSGEPNPECVALSKQEHQQVREGIARLKDKHRVVLLLKEVDGMSDEQIAAALGVPKGTVESRLHRARAQLSRWLRRQARRQSRRWS